MTNEEMKVLMDENFESGMICKDDGQLNNEFT